jgi:hypothetical protein
MANTEAVTDNFCDIVSLKNYVLTAYPNLILGLPLKTLTGVKFEKNSYFKIRSCDFEKWYQELINSMECFTNEATVQETQFIIKEKDFNYAYKCLILDEEKRILIELRCSNSLLTFSFGAYDVKCLMMGLADLFIKVYCLPDNLMELIFHFLNHFLSFHSWSADKGAKTISNLKYSDS